MKFLGSIVLAILVGYFMSSFLFKSYNGMVYGENNKMYFLKCNNCQNTFNTYIESDIDDDIYIGITSNINNVDKIKTFFKKKNIDIISEERINNNNDFYTELTQYDVLINNCNNTSELTSVLSSIISTYEEVVLNEN